MTSYLFTMADMESDAEFARRRGSKDKSKRKSRTGLYAGGAVAGAGALGASVRYGGAALDYRKRAGMAKSRGHNPKLMAKGLAGYGAKARIAEDINGIKAIPGKVRGYDYKGAPGRVMEGAKAIPGRVGASGGRARDAFKAGAGLRGKLGGVFNSGKVGRYGMLGAGVATGGALVGGGIMGAKAYRNRKKKK